MKACVRIAATIAFLLGAVVLLASVAVGAGVWLVKDPAAAKAAMLFDRVEAALTVADDALVHLKTSLAEATNRLNDVRKERSKLSRNSGADPIRRWLAQAVRETLAPEWDDLHETLHKVSEASVVVNSVLGDMGNLPALSVVGLDVGQLSELNDRLNQVGPAAWELSQLLGGEGRPSDLDAGDAQSSRIDQALQTMKEFLAKYKLDVRQVRERTAELKSRTLPWITHAAVVISLICFWIALSQVSVLCHAWSWWKHSGRSQVAPSTERK
jgi:hypothetical protein